MTAKRLNLEVIAEGVEDCNELNTLRELGCDQFQGYLFDKPLQASELNERFERNHYPVDDTHPIKAIQK